MILAGEFYAGGLSRWNLGWPTPNYAGAFQATLLAMAFAFSGSRWRWWALALEVVGFFLLAKTYSRGAVVAWCAAWGFGFLAARGWRETAQRLLWGNRLLALAVILVVVGFNVSRTSTSEPGLVQATAADGSVVNRLSLWRGGLKMIVAAPLTGWGAGESGRGYMNWYQDLDRDEGYTTMVNSYLHVAVERGVPMLLVVVFGLAWLLAVAWRGANAESASPASRFLHVAAGASLVAWAAANVFTTLWIEPKLWIVPAIACLVLGWTAWKNAGIGLGPLTAASMGIAVFVVGGLYGAGRWLLRSEPLSITPGTNGSVLVGATESADAVWHAWPDPTVLGPTPGKELRRWQPAGARNPRLIVHRAAPLQSGDLAGDTKGVMLFGRQAERFGRDFSPECGEFWLIHPLGSPPQTPSLERSGASITVLLPEIDEAGNGPVWRHWAAATGARVVVSASTGLDIRAVWPDVMKDLGTADKR